jgi:hypothetical protein
MSIARELDLFASVDQGGFPPLSPPERVRVPLDPNWPDGETLFDDDVRVGVLCKRSHTRSVVALRIPKKKKSKKEKKNTAHN